MPSGRSIELREISTVSLVLASIQWPKSCETSICPGDAGADCVPLEAGALAALGAGDAPSGKVGPPVSLPAYGLGRASAQASAEPVACLFPEPVPPELAPDDEPWPKGNVGPPPTVPANGSTGGVPPELAPDGEPWPKGNVGPPPTLPAKGSTGGFAGGAAPDGELGPKGSVGPPPTLPPKALTEGFAVGVLPEVAPDGEPWPRGRVGPP